MAKGILMTSGNAAKAIAMAGLACGVLDITARGGVWFDGLKAAAIVAGSPAVCWGQNRSREECHRGARLGVAFVIAFGAAAFTSLRAAPCRFWWSKPCCLAALRHRRLLLHEPHRCAPLGATKFPFSLKMMLIGVVIHIFCVGLPIALA